MQQSLLPQENIVNIDIFGKNRIIFETDYQKAVVSNCDSGYSSYPYDNFSLAGQPLAGLLHPPDQEEIAAMIVALKAQGISAAAASRLAAGMGGPGGSGLASINGVLRRNMYTEGGKCYLSYNGQVFGPFGCSGRRVVKRVSWREIVSH